MRFLDILVVLRLDLGQISFNLVENPIATRQLVLLAARIAFYDILAVQTQKSNFFFSFSFLLAAVIDLLPGLLAVKKLLRKSHQGGKFLTWNSLVWWEEILL